MTCSVPADAVSRFAWLERSAARLCGLKALNRVAPAPPARALFLSAATGVPGRSSQLLCMAASFVRSVARRSLMSAASARTLSSAAGKIKAPPMVFIRGEEMTR